MKTSESSMPTSAGPQSSRLIVPFIAFCLIVFVIWADWAVVDQIVRGPGTVIPSSRNQVIQVMEQGMVDEIMVREGEFVKRGQILL
ncbi:MAG: HlyD family type I secretion periplasmic adaptor subunit, partial [Magnetococcales bacterium]|nr:HlyD family type I secretion periplasmic adaptor subunit [Magnetococcales bacterium]